MYFGVLYCIVLFDKCASKVRRQTLEVLKWPIKSKIFTNWLIIGFMSKNAIQGFILTFFLRALYLIASLLKKKNVFFQESTRKRRNILDFKDCLLIWEDNSRIPKQMTLEVKLDFSHEILSSAVINDCCSCYLCIQCLTIAF